MRKLILVIAPFLFLVFIVLIVVGFFLLFVGFILALIWYFLQGFLRLVVGMEDKGDMEFEDPAGYALLQYNKYFNPNAPLWP